MYELTALVHVPPLWQGFGAQLSVSVSHVVPVYPGAHEQVKPPAPLTHKPPFLQRSSAQLSVAVSQFAPVKPPEHEHE